MSSYKSMIDTSIRKSILSIVLIPALLLLIPLVAMQFTDEVNWDLADFVVAWILLAGAGLAYKLSVRKVNSTAHGIAVAIAVFLTLALIWAHLAVGLW